MAEVTRRSFPYPVHPAAHLGPLDEAVVEDLVERIRTFGYSESEPLLLYRGSILDGRHRQEACVRLGIEPPVVKADLKGMTPHEWVLNRHHLRSISDKEKMIFVIESFPDEGTTKLARRLGWEPKGKGMMTLSDIRAIFKKAKPKVWRDFKEGKISRAKANELAGIVERKGGVHKLKEQLDETQGELIDKRALVTELADDNEMLLRDLEESKTYIKELEKRVKSLDPKERIARSAENQTTAEDRLRDRLEFAEEELKKSQKLNEAFKTKVRDMERLEHVFTDTISGMDLSTFAVNPPKLSSGTSSRPHEFLALMSDAHFGEVVNPSEALGIAYDTDIARRRIEHYRDTVIRYKDLRAPAYDVSKLTLAVLGDMLSGSIHDELTITNERTMTEQSTEMGRILLGISKDLAEEFPEVEVIVIPGNHPRLNKKPQHKQKWDNWEYAMGQFLKVAVEESPLENVNIVVPQDLVYIHEIFGYRIGMYHGDGVKSASFAGIPFYGMRQRREAIQALLSSIGLPRIDMLVMGHFHQHLYWQGECDILINGAIKGGDEYSISSFSSAPAPEQVLLEWHPEHGLTAQEHISLGHIN